MYFNADVAENPQGTQISFKRTKNLRRLGLLCAICVNLLLALSAFTQITFSPSSTTSLSFTGVNFSIGATAQKGDFQAYLGPKIALSDSYLATEGPFGIMSSIKYFPNGQSKKFNSFVNMDYQLNFQKAFCPNGSCPSKTNLVHEYTLGYGFVYQVKRIGLMNAINIGRYSESFFNHSTHKRFKNSGYNTLIKIGVIVDVKKRREDE